MLNKYIMTYDDSNMTESIIGGKAASIVKLYKNNINVPKGIILPTKFWNEYEKTFDDNFLDEIVNEIVKILPAKKYIVRSSAVGEDSKFNSYAGCFDTILNVSKKEMKKAILTCGNSITGQRVKAYQKLNQKLPSISEIAILIQEYIIPDYSGVCFSLNPVTNKKEKILEFETGKSGAVVGGDSIPTMITETNYYNDKIDVQSKKICDIVFSEVNKIEKIWNCPVDVEWLIVDDEINITQTRPITTIK